MLDSQLLLPYVHNFYGYGNWKSKIWFIGIEEGGGGDEENIRKRLLSWSDLGSDNLLDIQDHHKNIGEAHLFTGNKVQHTWGKLIRCYLGFHARNNNINIDDVNEALKTSFGKKNSDTLLIELYPLASRKNTDWDYQKKQWTHIDFLQSRDVYYDYLTPLRIEFIKKQIREFEPKAVVFYSTTHKPSWEQIVGQLFIESELICKNHKAYFASNGTTKFAIAKHPAAVYSNDYWCELGKRLSNGKILAMTELS